MFFFWGGYYNIQKFICTFAWLCIPMAQNEVIWDSFQLQIRLKNYYGEEEFRL